MTCSYPGKSCGDPGQTGERSDAAGGQQHLARPRKKREKLKQYYSQERDLWSWGCCHAGRACGGSCCLCCGLCVIFTAGLSPDREGRVNCGAADRLSAETLLSLVRGCCACTCRIGNPSTLGLIFFSLVSLDSAGVKKPNTKPSKWQVSAETYSLHCSPIAVNLRGCEGLEGNLEAFYFPPYMTQRQKESLKVISSYQRTAQIAEQSTVRVPTPCLELDAAGSSGAVMFGLSVAL